MSLILPRSASLPPRASLPAHAPARPGRVSAHVFLGQARDVKPHAVAAPAAVAQQLLPSQLDARGPQPGACASASLEAEQFYAAQEQEVYMRQEVDLLAPLAQQLREADGTDRRVRSRAQPGAHVRAQRGQAR